MKNLRVMVLSAFAVASCLCGVCAAQTVTFTRTATDNSETVGEAGGSVQDGSGYINYQAIPNSSATQQFTGIVPPPLAAGGGNASPWQVLVAWVWQGRGQAPVFDNYWMQSQGSVGGNGSNANLVETAGIRQSTGTLNLCQQTRGGGIICGGSESAVSSFTTVVQNNATAWADIQFASNMQIGSTTGGANAQYYHPQVTIHVYLGSPHSSSPYATITGDPTVSLVYNAAMSPQGGPVSGTLNATVTGQTFTCDLNRLIYVPLTTGATVSYDISFSAGLGVSNNVPGQSSGQSMESFAFGLNTTGSTIVAMIFDADDSAGNV